MRKVLVPLMNLIIFTMIVEIRTLLRNYYCNINQSVTEYVINY